MRGQGLIIVVTVIGLLAVCLLAIAVMTTATGVRADEHQEDEITHNLGDKELGKPNKISSDLLALFEEYQAYVSIFGSDSGFQPSNPLLPVVGNRVIIDAVAQGNANNLKNDLKGLALQKGSGFGRSVSGQLPIMTIKGMIFHVDTARPLNLKTRC